MKRMKKVVALAVVAVMALSMLGACGSKKNTAQSTDAKKQTEATTEKKLNVVATIYPEYDFLRQIAGDKINLSLLLPPGGEVHTFDPTTKDLQAITKSDMFVYVGGDSDEWVEKVLGNLSKKTAVVKLMDQVKTIEEVEKEGMTPEKEEKEEKGGKEEKEYDEHVWTDPNNVITICNKLCAKLSKLDPDNAAVYKANTAAYVKKLQKLDKSFKDVVKTAKRKVIIVGDRFPFAYFAKRYGLDYFAAFPGCSADTEPSAKSLSFLIQKTKKEKIPVVFHIELSNEKVADAICKETGAKKALLNAVHNVSKADFDKGVTYLDLMNHNVDALKEALN